MIQCTNCLIEIEYGFLCEDSQKFLCQKCQDNYDMEKICIKHFKEIGGIMLHEHIRIPAKDGSRQEMLEKIELRQNILRKKLQFP